MGTESETTPKRSVRVDNGRCDDLFTEEQHARLLELRAKRPHLSRSEITELENLLEAEFEAAIARSTRLAGGSE